jgi:hypothetical protein
MTLKLRMLTELKKVCSCYGIFYGMYDTYMATAQYSSCFGILTVTNDVPCLGV